MYTPILRVISPAMRKGACAGSMTGMISPVIKLKYASFFPPTHAHGPGFFHTKRPVNNMEELKGLRIKSDANTSKVVAAAGATPTTMPMLETYDALKRGLTDGVLLPIETLKGWKFGEVCKYTYENPGNAYSNGFFIAMNKETWNSLPKDIQQIIYKLDEEFFEKRATIWRTIDEEG